MHGSTKRQQHVRIHALVDGGYGIGPVSGVWCIVYIFTGIFEFRFLYTYVLIFDVVLLSERWMLWLCGVHRGFSPEAVYVAVIVWGLE